MQPIRCARIILTGMLISGLMACSGADTRSDSEPDWIFGNSGKYRNQQYLVGRGHADDVATAEDRARADLAKIFVVEVNVADIDKQHFSSATSGEKSESQLTAEVSRTIVTSTDKILKGVEIAEIWKDPVKQTVHALAVLPRKKAASAITGEISRLDGLTASSIEEAGKTKELLDKIAYARRAIIAQQERLGHQKSLQIIDTTGRGVRASYKIEELITDYEKLLPRINIEPIVMGDNQDIMATALPAAISSAGFSVTNGGGADYEMEVNLKLADTFQKEGWFWGRGLLVMTLRDKQNVVHGKKEWPIKVSAREESQVMIRAEQKAGDILQQELLATIVGFSQIGQTTIK